MSQQNNKIQTYPEVYLIIHGKGKDCIIEMRKRTNDIEAVRTILNAALLKKPIIMQPTFSERFRAISILCEKEIIKFNYEKSEYKFLI